MNTKYVIIFFNNNDTQVFGTFDTKEIAQQWGDANIDDGEEWEDDFMWHVTKLETRGNKS